MGHAVIALGVIRRHMAFVPPKEVQMLPGQSVTNGRVSRQQFMQTPRSRPTRERNGKWIRTRCRAVCHALDFAGRDTAYFFEIVNNFKAETIGFDSICKR
jgi:hypothetical protein